MIERDANLQRVLNEWKAPQPSARLDDRVWNSYASTRPRSSRRWLAIAAGLVLAGVVSMHLASNPRGPSKPGVTKLKTTTSAIGFEPLPDGAITITSLGAKQ